jgi:hypothetical protein
MILRDAVKAHVGFSSVASAQAAGLKHVCTGAWGCGIFNGDRYVKFLVQVRVGVTVFTRVHSRVLLPCFYSTAAVAGGERGWLG